MKWKKIRQASFLRYKKETQFGGQKKMANGNGRTTYCTIAHAFTYLSGEWKWNKAMKNQMEKKQQYEYKQPTKFTNKIVRSQRQLSVNCPTPWAIVNCYAIELTCPYNNDDDEDDIGEVHKTLHQHPETIWNKFDVCARCGVYDYKLSSYAHHHTKSDWSKLTEKNNRINTYIYERGQKSKANPNDNILCTLFMYVEKKRTYEDFSIFKIQIVRGMLTKPRNVKPNVESIAYRRNKI